MDFGTDGRIICGNCGIDTNECRCENILNRNYASPDATRIRKMKMFSRKGLKNFLCDFVKYYNDVDRILDSEVKVIDAFLTENEFYE